MSLYIGDLTLGIRPQAMAVLHLLASSECDDLGSEYNKEHRDYPIETHTYAWYNGRERGICLVVRPALSSKRCLVVTFGECRSSDSIFIDSWEHEGFFLNPPTVADFPGRLRASRRLRGYGNVAGAVDIIRRKIKAFMQVPERVLPDLGDEASN